MREEKEAQTHKVIMVLMEADSAVVGNTHQMEQPRGACLTYLEAIQGEDGIERRVMLKNVTKLREK